MKYFYEPFPSTFPKNGAADLAQLQELKSLASSTIPSHEAKCSLN